MTKLKKLIIFVGAISFLYAGYAVVTFMEFQFRHMSVNSMVWLWVGNVVNSEAKKRGCSMAYVKDVGSCGFTVEMKHCLSVKADIAACPSFAKVELLNVLNNICYYAELNYKDSDLISAFYALECYDGYRYVLRVDDEVK